MNPNPPAGSFSGELGVVGLFDLGQLLMLNGATGCLVVHSGAKRGFLYFVSGRLTNAVDDANAQGEGAAYRVFSWRSGAFQFRPEPPSGAPVIQNSTEAVMLEAARRIDEASPAAGTSGAPRVTERLSERQESLEALRDVFRQVTRDASASAVTDASPSPTLHLYELERPGDRLVYRPDRPPRMRRAGEWREPVEPALTPEEYGKVRAYLLGTCRPPGETLEGGAKEAGAVPPGLVHDDPSAPRELKLADGRTIALDFVTDRAEESMWLRPVGLPPPDASRLRGSLDRLEQVLGLTHGIVLVGGPDLESAREMLHAVIAMILDHSADSLLLASADPTYAHPEGRGVLSRTAPEALPERLRSLEPDIVALDPGLGRGHVALHDLELVPRVIASVVVADPASLVARWIERVDEGNVARAVISLATTPIGLVMAYPGAIDADTLAFNAWILSERERGLALRGEIGTLSPLLQQATARVRMERRRKAA